MVDVINSSPSTISPPSPQIGQGAEGNPSLIPRVGDAEVLLGLAEGLVLALERLVGSYGGYGYEQQS